jgi:hypothetical protein
MTPSLTDQRRGSPSQPVRFLPLNTETHPPDESESPASVTDWPGKLKARIVMTRKVTLQMMALFFLLFIRIYLIVISL